MAEDRQPGPAPASNNTAVQQPDVGKSITGSGWIDAPLLEPQLVALEAIRPAGGPVAEVRASEPAGAQAATTPIASGDGTPKS